MSTVSGGDLVLAVGSPVHHLPGVREMKIQRRSARNGTNLCDAATFASGPMRAIVAWMKRTFSES